MKQGIVKFSKEFITNTGLKEWVGIEWPVDFENDNVIGAFNQAKKAVCDFQLASNATSIESIPPYPPSVIQVKPEEREIGLTPESIMSSPDLKVLETYRWLIKGKPELERAYILRYDELTTLTTNNDGSEWIITKQ